MDVLIEILNTIAKLRSSVELSSMLQESTNNSMHVLMETDLEKKNN